MKTSVRFPISICLFFILYAHAGYSSTGNQITVFNTGITIDSPLIREEFPTGYPFVIGSSHVFKCSAKGVSDYNQSAIFDAIKRDINGNIPNGIPFIIAFFTNNKTGNTLEIRKSETHAFCAAFYENSILYFYYFEKNPSGSYDLIPELNTKINSYSDELFLSLHLSHFSLTTFPGNSTVYCFISGAETHVSSADGSDVIIKLSKDYERQVGLFPLGMADSSVLVSLGRYNGAGASNCGGDCPFENDKICETLTVPEGIFQRCVRGMCGLSQAGDCARNAGINLGVDFKYKELRDFRDNFMSRYCEGRKYIGFYYTFSKYIKLDVPMLWKYAALLPDLYNAINNLLDVSNDRIIITSDLKEKALEIVRDHIDVGGDYFQTILNQVASDFVAYEGIKRSELTGILNPYTQGCSESRKGKANSIDNDLSFIYVYSNASKKEISINYSIPGTNVKFELYNASSAIVSSIKNLLPAQKFSIPTTSLESGIYLYRIGSDTGYQKTGKVTILK